MCVVGETLLTGSIYGKAFADEDLSGRHDRVGVLSMVPAGANANASQFLITFGPAPHLDGKHVVFVRVLAGFDILVGTGPCYHRYCLLRLLTEGSTRQARNQSRWNTQNTCVYPLCW